MAASWPAALLLLLLSPAWAVAPDLVQTQWRHEGLGEAAAACTAAGGAAVLWAGGGAALLDARGGLVARRQALPPPVGTAASCAAVFSAAGRAWAWPPPGPAAALPEPAWSIEPPAAPVLQALHVPPALWVLRAPRLLSAHSARDGSLLWQAEAADGEEFGPLSLLGEELFAPAFGPRAARLARLDPHSGALRSSTSFLPPLGAAPLVAASAAGRGLLAVDEAGSVLFGVAAGPLAPVVSLPGVVPLLLTHPAWDHAILSYPDTVRTLRLRADGAQADDPVHGIAAATGSDGALFEFATNRTRLWRGQVEVVYTTPLQVTLPLRRMLLTGPAAVLFVGADLRHVLVADTGAIIWQRDEALTATVDATFADLPAPTTSLASWLGSVTPAASHAALRDKYGLRKLAVVLSAVHTVHGLLTEGGAELWRAQLPVPAREEATWARVWALGGSDRVVALVSFPSEAHLAALDAGTGRILEHERFPGPLLHAALLGVPAAAEAVLVVPLPPSAAFAWPRGPRAEAQLAAAAPHVCFFKHSPSRLHAYGLVVPAMRAEERWVQHLSSGEEFAAVAASAPDEAVSSGVRVLGDGSVLHKSPLAPAALLALAANASAQTLRASLLHCPTGAVLHTVAHESGSRALLSCEERALAGLLGLGRASAPAATGHLRALLSRP